MPEINPPIPKVGIPIAILIATIISAHLRSPLISGTINPKKNVVHENHI